MILIQTLKAMTKRSVLYWLVCTVLAFFAAAHAGESSSAVDAVRTAATVQANVLQVPESVRAVLLFLGIFAVAFCYNRAWVNFRRKPGS